MERHPLRRGWDPASARAVGAPATAHAKPPAAGAERANKLDPLIFALASELAVPPPKSAAASVPSLTVLVWTSGDVSFPVGSRVRSHAGGVATVDLPWSALEGLQHDSRVRYIELPRPARPQLDRTTPYLGARRLHRGTPSFTGRGVTIGIIDADGIDYLHPDFCAVDEHGALRTRIAAIWDQCAEPGQDGGSAPSPWGYGAEVTREAIDRALAAAAAGAPRAGLRVDRGTACAHGTHVAGVAAGNGRASLGKYVGVAPGADIVFVNTASEGFGFGDMARVCDALDYVFERAGERPCVANLSLGDNLGPHDGTSLVEHRIDHYAAASGRAVVVAAGNEAIEGKHTHAVLPAGPRAEALALLLPPDLGPGEAVEVWYPGDDRMELALVDDGGAELGPVAPGGSVSATAFGGLRISVASRVHDGRNGDNVIGIALSEERRAGPPRSAGDGASGAGRTQRLEVVLRRPMGMRAPPRLGSYHAWIAGASYARWARPTSPCTLVVPGTGRRSITVGMHYLQGVDEVSAISGRGWTRDGRPKPDLVAPGNGVMAPSPDASPTLGKQDTGEALPFYARGRGTSLSAPHVAGLIALLFERDGPLDAEQVKSRLREMADATGVTVPDPAYGWGRARIV